MFLEFADEVLEDGVVEVLAAEEGVAVGGADLEDARLHLENGDVEGAAAEIVDGHEQVLLVVEAEGERGRRRLVDHAQHVEAADLAGVLGRLTLRVVEVGRHRDDGILDRCAQIGLGRLLHLGEHEGADLTRRVHLAHGLDPGVAVARLDDLERDALHLFLHLRVLEAATDETLRRVERVLRIGDRLALGWRAHQALAVLAEGDHRRCGAHALGVLDHSGRAALHHSHARVGRAQVDADHLTAHLLVSFRRIL